MALTGNVLFAAIPSALDGGTSYTGQGASEAAAGSHLDERPAKTTTIATMTPMVSTFAGAGSVRGSLDWVGIINHNLDRRRDSLWRTWAYAHNGTPPSSETLQQLYPTSVDASTNLAGAETDVDDDPWAASADYLTGTFNLAWSARLGFATPSGTLSSVGGATVKDHAVVVRAEAPTGSGELTVKLYDGGVAKATLIDAETVGVADELGRKVYVGTFNTSQLDDTSGADLQIQVEGNGTGVRVYSVLLVLGKDRGGTVYDSGFIPVDSPAASSAFGSTNSGSAGEEPTQNDFHAMATPLTYTGASMPYIRVAFVNGTNAASPTNKLGVLAAGKFWQPTKNAGYVSLSVEDASTKGRTLGGQTYGSNRRRRRIATVALEDLTRSQMLELFERIDWRKGRLGAFFVCLFPDDTYGKRITGFWGTLGESEMTGAWEPYNASDANDAASVIRWRRTYQIEEKL